MNCEWKIINRAIDVECPCGNLIIFDEADIERIAHKTCRVCKRIIAVHFDIMVTKPRESEDK